MRIHSLAAGVAVAALIPLTTAGAEEPPVDPASDAALVAAAALTDDPFLAVGLLLGVAEPGSTPGWLQAAVGATRGEVPIAWTPGPPIPPRGWWRAAEQAAGDDVIACSWNHDACFRWDPSSPAPPVLVELGEDGIALGARSV
jgi:hypothetical protein